MKLKLLFVALIAILYSCKNTSQTPTSNFTRTVDFNFNWKFTLVKDTTLPSQVPLKDIDWRDVRLPHDWSVELPFSEEWEGATGYLPGGVGIYQKHFKTPASPAEKSTFINFDGVYNNATFWLNGTKLGFNPYGYSPINYDLTNLLKTDGSDNILTVHVDRSRYADSRWYTGSGIYRNVKLVVLDKLHIPIWGTFVTTPEINGSSAQVQIKIDVENQYTDNASFDLETKILDASGSVVAQSLDALSLDSKAKKTFTQNLEVSNPQLWGTLTPHLYKAVTTISKNGKTVDEYTTRFGIRSLEFSKDFGFKLNGKITNIKGVCLHHAAGLVGAAVPKGVWKRRIESLKACGVNAIRTAHNPYSKEFLELCDEMGILVQDEFFDEWDYAKDKRTNYHDRSFDYITRGYVEHFQEWAKTDLTRTMLRDRNHPSVFQWSIGNEIEWTYLHYRYATGFWKDPNDPQNAGSYWGSGPILTPEEIKANYDAAEKGTYILAETAHKLAKWTRELDPTRVVTTNMVVPQTSMVSGYADAVDISGFSYRNKDIAWAIKHWPNRHITINENPGTLDDWKHVEEHPGVFSIFMWTGIDYMGERHGDWPEKSGWGDLLDLAGFKYQGWNYFKSIWVDKPHISIGTLPVAKSGFKQTGISGQQLPENSSAYKWRDSNMHWNYKEGEPVVVEVCSNYPTVELFINGRSLGNRKMSPDRLFRWTIPYEAGTLTAKASLDDKEIMTELHTTNKPVSIKFTSDKEVLKADGYDVAHLVVQLIDENGREVKTENTDIEFSVEGNASWLGVDNGARSNIQDFKSKKITTSKGRALAIIQSTKEAGVVTITVKAEGFKSQIITINSK
ncbi:glycoside hydrolase family 2 TIM barrel-domain containing protein [Flavobacteriaceae bacterium MHTCC 0001]